ncbi:Predicted small integral membrane protein [Pseudomonas gessardii]|uniref:DUF2165 domain-containing protein n=1 Tax=Pseudomonas gessardii TaxID=78544 RepID=A0A7Y1MJS9_9PSED|nr:DUF2165 family protein [Pseudomonas gessardii]MRU49333.1 DUF2165 domain-containing protein [Pseudomonas gessardii]NNA93560.1 DUF2165 domain-containing protein [Pseudomonas gessardii]ONH49059.1 hypothetical protein BLL38_03215 [Pseudomonas gessardii]SDR37586.1 Predicted small integral membrane protein [Pseudomonas gessardii]
MDLPTSLLIFQTVLILGFGLWLSLALINNLHAFAGSAGAVGATMSMAPLREHPPIGTPLLVRAVQSATLHRLALALIILLQAGAVLTVWIGCYALLWGTGLEAARPWLNLALSAALGFVMLMLLAGLWFGYWIRQEGLQLTHLLLVVWMLLGFVVLNLRWV